MSKRWGVIFVFACAWACSAVASEEEWLEWTSASIQCESSPVAGDVSCEITRGAKGYEKFVINAFGKTHRLAEADLAKLKDFPLASLRTRYEAGYEKLGGYTVHFRFERSFVDPAKKVTVVERLYVSVTKNGVSLQGPLKISP